MSKRILIFSVAYEPFIGGAEVAVREITNRINSSEYTFDMITVNLDGKQKKEERIGNVMVYRIGTGTIGKFLLPFTGFYKAWRLHKSHPYNAVWSIMASQASIAASFFNYFFPYIPLVLTVQEGDEESHLKRYVFGLESLYTIFIRPWHTLVFKKADIITSISHYLANRAYAINPQARIEIIPNGVDIPLFTKSFSDLELEPIIKEIGKQKDDRIIITTSRLVEKNAVGDIIAALEYLPEHIKCIILGIGPLEQELRQKAELLHVSDRVIFLGQKVYSDIPKYLAVSHVFIRPSLSEGMGNSFIEAMAAGIPVIATNVGGIPDFLKDQETGLFCKVNNPHSIADKVSHILSDNDLKHHITTQALNLVIGKYDWESITTLMKTKVFNEIQ